MTPRRRSTVVTDRLLIFIMGMLISAMIGASIVYVVMR